MPLELTVSTWTDERALSTEDYIEIQQLYARYNFAIDLRDVETWLECFTVDGSLGMAVKEGDATPPPVTTGRDALRAQVQVIAASRAAAGYHWNANVHLTTSETGATGRCYFMLVRPKEGGGELSLTGYYQDELVRLDGRWMFRSRRVHSL